ncbi:hypothetical protein EVAR_35218_1 [Eumeta japonica]|uniref:Uncharacterized protein n=1 Tax=Eumeta variegata TaxID=151549 RepID=A0A4C1VFA7_EUMVA|nr:hypothetical protein EVAR_35218_1 [Eumeta japonica]
METFRLWDVAAEVVFGSASARRSRAGDRPSPQPIQGTAQRPLAGRDGERRHARTARAASADVSHDIYTRHITHTKSIRRAPPPPARPAGATSILKSDGARGRRRDTSDGLQESESMHIF